VCTRDRETVIRKRKGGKQTVVPVDEETIQTIERFKFTRPSNGDSDYLFLSIRGNRVSKTQVQRAVKDAAVEAGVMERAEDRFHKKFTPHTYRTVFTTLMRNQGMKKHILRYIRGDAASETVDIYTKIDREDARKEYLILWTTLITIPCVLWTRMDETYVRLVCPECSKDWESNPTDLPESDGTFHCPNCHASRGMSEFTRTEHDLRTLQKMG